MNRLVLIFISILVIASCRSNQAVVKESDYKPYLNPVFINNQKKAAGSEKKFWINRLMADTGNYINKRELAKQYIQYFKLSGEIENLSIADSLLRAASAKINYKDAGTLYVQSQNAITQHRFSDAWMYNEMAEQADPNPYINHLLAFDAGMELGKYYEASKKISNLRDKTDFNYLIRLSKSEDRRGRLDKAIELIEKAAAVMEHKRKSNYLWALTNLADMYGHAGRIKDAYQTYLRVLTEDSANLYCLKGIAWIAYSHDRNIRMAKNILQFIQAQTRMPDLLLQLAEMEQLEGNTERAKAYRKEFADEVTQPAYGDMYNKYLIQLYAEEYIEFDKAIELAEKETRNRPTPETYDWLGWVYFRKGDKQKAFEIVMEYVYKKTFEPDALLHCAYILAENGRKEDAEKLFEECLESSFELGPETTAVIKEQLKSMR
jgi:tetratricopeptide (TPR) repeat protein